MKTSLITYLPAPLLRQATIASLPSVNDDYYRITGANLLGVLEVEFAGKKIGTKWSSTHDSAWANGYFRVFGDDTIWFYPPQGLTPGDYTFTVRNAAATSNGLTLSVTKQLAGAAEAFAREHEWNVVIAIVDDGGHLLYLQRMDGVQTASVTVAMRKAEAADPDWIGGQASFDRAGQLRQARALPRRDRHDAGPASRALLRLDECVRGLGSDQVALVQNEHLRLASRAELVQQPVHLLHLLAPNMRPQQVTDDLESFWANTYAVVRKELRRRYPKHAWPEDPLTASPTRKAR